MHENEIGERLIGCAIKVHRALGPGLLESAYEVCLAHELQKAGMRFERQRALPVEYDGLKIVAGYRMDLLVENKVVAELKTVDRLTDVHVAQLLTYLRLGGFKLGYLLNFNVVELRSGIRRVVLRL
jgi:GxxExxY protein